MATMTEFHANLLSPTERAIILFDLDRKVRDVVNDEEIFEEWLIYGVPDGTESWEELTDISKEGFVEMWNLAERLMNCAIASVDWQDYDEDE